MDGFSARYGAQRNSLTAFLSALCEPGKRHGWSAIMRRALEGFIAKVSQPRPVSDTLNAREPI
jgi:hypothetical protein